MNAAGASQFHRSLRADRLSTSARFTFPRWNFLRGARLERAGALQSRLVSWGTELKNDLPKERPNSGATPLRPVDTAGTPLPDSKAEQPPVIRRAEVVAFALVALLIIAVTVV